MSEVIPVRSRNGNVFKFSSYWHNWSRVLFHDPMDSRGMMAMRKFYRIPQHIRSIELELTAINPHVDIDWRDRVQYANIRTHNTPARAKDLITGSLPAEAIELMREWLPDSTIDMLLHGDYLDLLDFERMQLNGQGGGGVSFAKACKSPMSLRQWQAAEGNSRLMHVDICDWQAYADDLGGRVAALTPYQFDYWNK
jgi:hypothetical protein